MNHIEQHQNSHHLQFEPVMAEIRNQQSERWAEKLQERIGYDAEVWLQQAEHLAREMVAEIGRLEQYAKEKMHVDPEVAKKIGAIWVLSGPGTYIVEKKKDRYENKPWAAWMDRKRLNLGALLMRKISEIRAGIPDRGSPGDIQARKRQASEAIARVGPILIYNGRPDETETAMKVLDEQGVIIPKSKVLMQGGTNIDSSLDQVVQVRIPEEVIANHTELAIVSHAPHLARLVRVLGARQDFPKIPIRLFPLSTPIGGQQEYTSDEIAGTAYYVLVQQPPIATIEPYPYKIGFEP